MAGLEFSSGIDKGFEKDLQRMNKQMNGFSKNVQKQSSAINSSFKEIGATIGAFASIAALGRAGKELISFSTDLENSLTEVSTISAEVTDNFDEYKQTLLEMSSDQELAASTAIELSDAFYDIVSAGFDAEQGLAVLDAAARAGTAGFVEASVAADGLTTVLNAWGKDASEVTQVSDVFFKTVEKGKTTFSELGSNISQVAPLAASLGVSFEEVAGAAATITKSGVPTSQAFTQIRSALVGMTQELGNGWAETMTLQEGFQEISDRAGGSATAIQGLVGRVEGMSAILALTGKNAQVAASDLDAMTKSLGATEQAVQKVTDTASQQGKALVNNILAALEPLGSAAIDTFAELAKSLNEAFKSGDIEKYVKILSTLIAALAAWKISIFAVNQAQKINTVITNINTAAQRASAISGKSVTAGNYLMAKSFKAINKAVKANPIGLLVTGLTLAIPLISALNEGFKDTDDIIDEVTRSVNKQVAASTGEYKALINQLKDTNTSQERRAEIIDEVNTKYGKYLPNLIEERDTLEQINQKTEKGIENLQKQVRAQAFREQAVKFETKIAQLLVDQLEAQELLDKTARGSGSRKVYESNLADIAAEIKKEKEAAQRIYDLISEEADFTTPTQAPTIAEVKAKTIDPKKAAADAIKALEIANQLRINEITKQYANEVILEEEFNKKQLEARLDYLTKLGKLTTDNLKKLKIEEEKINTQFALDSIGRDEEKAAKEKQDALLKQYETYLQKRERLIKESQDKITTLEGAKGADIAIKEIEKELEKTLKTLELQYIKATSGINKLFTDTKNKSLDEIKELTEGAEALLSSLESGEFQEDNVFGISEDEFEKIKASPELINLVRESLERLRDASKDTSNAFQLISQGIKDIGEAENNTQFGEGLSKIQEGAKVATDAVSFLGDAIGEIGSATGIQGLSDTAEKLQDIVSVAGDVSQGMSTGFAVGGPIGAAIGGTIGLIKGVAGVFTRIKNENKELIEGASRTRASINKIAESSARDLALIQSSYDTIFGSSDFGKAFEATKISISEANAQLAKYSNQLSNVDIKTKEGGWFKGDTYKGLLQLYPDLIDSQGRLNKEVAEGVLASGQLNDVQKESVQGALDATAAIEDAYGAMGDYLSGIFGSLGDDIAQAFQVMHEEGDDAMTSLEGSFSDMIEKFTQDAIQFAFLQPYLDQLNETTKAEVFRLRIYKKI